MLSNLFGVGVLNASMDISNMFGIDVFNASYVLSPIVVEVLNRPIYIEHGNGRRIGHGCHTSNIAEAEISNTAKCRTCTRVEVLHLWYHIATRIVGCVNTDMKCSFQADPKK